MTRYLAAAAILAICWPAARAADAALPEGNWRLSEKGSVLADQRLCLLKVEMKDGKLVATIIDTMEIRQRGKDPRKLNVKLESFAADGKTVVFKLNVNQQPVSFEGTVDPKNPGVVRGALFEGKRILRGEIVSQTGDKIEPAVATKQPEPFAQAMKLNQAHFPYLIRAQQTKDANEKADLQAKAKETRKDAEQKIPGLYRQVIDDHGETIHAVYAATQLINSARKTKSTAQDVAQWVKILEADAAKYGPRFARATALDIAEDLVGHSGYEALTFAAAVKGAEGATDKDPLLAQSRLLKLMVPALKGVGKLEESKASEARLAKVETALDDEYVRTVPPFEPVKFAGRKDKEANRVVVMELFTGAQCPPCVAADVGFDALQKSYNSTDLVLIQYHMHIPGPDPLTNRDTVARFEFYGEKFPGQVGGTPTTLFNGKPQAGGGGGMANSQKKFDQYKNIIDTLLEEKSAIKIVGAAKRAGETVTVDVSVDGIKEASSHLKLRVVLVEESLKYVGGNGLRFHHQVVRAVPNVKEGIAITGTSIKKTVDIDLAGLRRDLTKYLDDYAANESPFPNPDRPMAFKHLKAIVLVQNDDSGEILNAAQFEVK